MGADQDFAAFVAARGTSLFRLACLLTGSPSEAEDLVQDSLEKVYLRWSRVSGADAPYPYVRRLMVNTLVSTRRRPAERAEVSWSSPPDGLVDSPRTGRARPRARLAARRRASHEAARRHRAALLRGPLRAADRRCPRLLAGQREVPGPRRAGDPAPGHGCEGGGGGMTGALEDQLLREVLAHEAHRHEAPAFDPDAVVAGRAPGGDVAAQSSAAPLSPSPSSQRPRCTRPRAWVPATPRQRSSRRGRGTRSRGSGSPARRRHR